VPLLTVLTQAAVDCHRTQSAWRAPTQVQKQAGWQSHSRTGAMGLEEQQAVAEHAAVVVHLRAQPPNDRDHACSWSSRMGEFSRTCDYHKVVLLLPRIVKGRLCRICITALRSIDRSRLDVHRVTSHSAAGIFRTNIQRLLRKPACAGDEGDGGGDTAHLLQPVLLEGRILQHQVRRHRIVHNPQQAHDEAARKQGHTC